MTLWRLEVARLVRTKRWMVLVGVYVFFGVVGPLTARYINEILGQFAAELAPTAPAPRPVDGLAQFIGNASQLGLLAVVVVAAAALAADTKPELAAFIRTKVPHPGWLVLPPVVVTAAAAIASLVVGTALAWGLTTALIGSLQAGPLLLGTLLGAVYLTFVCVLVAALSGLTSSQGATVFAALATLLVLPILGLVQPVKRWLPSELLSAVTGLVEGAAPGDYARATLVTLVATGALAWVAFHRAARREL